MIFRQLFDSRNRGLRHRENPMTNSNGVGGRGRAARFVRQIARNSNGECRDVCYRRISAGRIRASCAAAKLPGSRKGIALVEVIVAMVLLAVAVSSLAALVYSVSHSGIKTAGDAYKNGVLLKMMVQENYEVFITADQNLEYQQNLKLIQIAIAWY